MTYLAMFEVYADNKRFSRKIDAPCLEDATIEASNIADEKEAELLCIDEMFSFPSNFNDPF